MESRLLTAAEIGQRLPDLGTDDIERGFMFKGGFSLDPYTVTMTVMERARDHGVEVRTEPAESITPHSRGTTRVTTTEQTYTASTVVLAAGAWRKALAEEIDVSLPLKPRISQIVTGDPESDIHLPLCNDPDLYLYYRTEANGEVLIGGGTGKTELDPEYGLERACPQFV